MKKNAFTLIELLAVIVILAIIAIIAVPIVVNIINDAKEESLKRSVQHYLDSVTNTITKENLKVKYNPDECIIQEDGNLICSENGNELTTSDGTNILKIDIKGKKPESGTIYLNNGKIIDIIDININGRLYEFDSKGNIVRYDMPTVPGLYDKDKKLLATWSELVSKYRLDITKNYTYNTYNKKNSGSMYDVLNNNNELKDGKILVIEENETNDKIGEYAFGACRGLISVIIPSSVKSIGGFAFDYCTGLTSLTIPSSVKSIGGNSFRDCVGLTSLTIPSSVKSIGIQAFFGCEGLASISVDSGNTIYEDRNSNAIIEKSTNTLTLGCKNTEILSSVTSIGYWAFAECTGLTSIIIPNSVTSISEGAFYGCGLTSIVIPNSVTSISDDTFVYCTNLISVTIPNSVTSIGESAFMDCESLTSITIPSSVISIGDSAFCNCKNLKSITIPNSVTSIEDWAFAGNDLTSIIIPSSVIFIGMDAFVDCDNLTSVTFENTSGWYITEDEEETSGTSINVTNASTNATNLYATYVDYYWKRTN